MPILILTEVSINCKLWHLVEINTCPWKQYLISLARKQIKTLNLLYIYSKPILIRWIRISRTIHKMERKGKEKNIFLHHVWRITPEFLNWCILDKDMIVKNTCETVQKQDFFIFARKSAFERTNFSWISIVCILQTWLQIWKIYSDRSSLMQKSLARYVSTTSASYTIYNLYIHHKKM